MNIDRTKKHYPLFFTYRVKACALLLICSVFSIGAVNAGTVTNEDDSGAGSLRDVISAASAGETIDFQSGVVTIPLLTPILIDKNLTIDGPNVTISGGGATQIFNIASVTVELNGLTLSNGYGQYGGAIKTSAASTIVATDCTFTGNNARFHGGVMSITSNSTITATNCTFSGNSAGYNGGAIDITSSSTITATNCTFSGNTGGGAGGAIENATNSTITATNCTFSANNGFTGGAIDNYSNSTITATGCTFSGNSAIYFGGAIDNFFNNSTVTVTNCTFNGNNAGFFGGAMRSHYNTVATATNCTFSGNSAATYGGAFYTGLNATFNFNNSIIAGNSAVMGPDGYGAIVSNGHNFIGDTSSITGVELIDKTFANTSTTLSDLVETAGPAPLLKNNGGVTDTIALIAGSPAINSGDNAAVVGIDYDQRGLGFSRIVDGVVDIGAYEATIKTPLEKTNDLIAAVLNLGLSKGTQQSLLSKLFDVEVALNQHPIDLQTACDELTAFTDQVSALSGKKIDSVDAAMLIAQANEIKLDLNCT